MNRYILFKGIPFMVVRMPIVMALCLGIVFFSSCGKQKATITVHYEITNSSGMDLKVSSSYRDFSILPNGKEAFTDVQEGIEYYGSCSFENVFADGFSLTITYKGEEHTLTGAERYSTLDDLSSYSIKKIAPREYSVHYSFPMYEIFDCLGVMGVEVEERYYDYPYGYPYDE